LLKWKLILAKTSHILVGVQLVFKNHPAFQPPDDGDAKIWRYMDFTKYVSMLDTSRLHFCRIDKLDDKFEGSLPHTYYLTERMNRFLKKRFPEKYQRLSSQGKFQTNKLSAIGQARRKWAFVNCWHMSNDESVAMWKLYLKSNEGVAIQTTYNNLCEAFNECKYDVWIGIVKYIDYNSAKIPSGNSNYRFVYKRKAFDYEKELRAVIRRYPISEKELNSGQVTIEELAEANIYPKYMKIPVNLDTLVQKVYVSPFTDQWFVNLVSAVTEKYGLEKEVSKSPLSQPPVY
jgi:hypothetical protein